MEELRLTRPTEAMSGEISAYRQAMLDAGSEMDGCGPLSRMEDPAEWIAFCKTLDEGTNVPERWIPATQFVCLRGEKIVGMIQVRRELNDFLREYAGHIGYSVRPDERKKGVATWMLQNVLPYCRDIGLTRVMVAEDTPISLEIWEKVLPASSISATCRRWVMAWISLKVHRSSKKR